MKKDSHLFFMMYSGAVLATGGELGLDSLGDLSLERSVERIQEVGVGLLTLLRLILSLFDSQEVEPRFRKHSLYEYT
jgi:hypothetical protein